MCQANTGKPTCRGHGSSFGAKVTSKKNNLGSYVLLLTTRGLPGREVLESLAMYVDYERLGRDMELSGYMFTFQPAYNDVYVFWSH